jgi:hypothetical protein
MVTDCGENPPLRIVTLAPPPPPPPPPLGVGVGVGGGPAFGSTTTVPVRFVVVDL